MEDAGSGFELSVNESTEFRRGGTIQGLGANQRIVSSALDMEVGAIDGPVVNNRDVILFEVTDRVFYDPVEFENEKAEARETLRAERVNQILSSLITQRREELGVRYDPQLLENFELASIS